MRCFGLDVTASVTAVLTGISRRSVNVIFTRIRERRAEGCERNAIIERGEAELDESHFGPRRARGKPGRGAGGKTIVFGIFDHGGKVYTEIVPDCKKRTLQAVIRGRVGLGTVIHSDDWKGYDGLVDVGYQTHFRVRHKDRKFAVGRSHINGIECGPVLAQFGALPSDGWQSLTGRVVSNFGST